ncbi:MAG: hypothetical protein EOM21_17715 [Gammaproteobacteria bacterium]|nr:hypothetical protein [Gammaproteobacteria bacterium]
MERDEALLRKVMYATESETLSGVKDQSFEIVKRRLKAYRELIEALDLRIVTEKLYHHNEYLGKYEALCAGYVRITTNGAVLDAFRRMAEEADQQPDKRVCHL